MVFRFQGVKIEGSAGPKYLPNSCRGPFEVLYTLVVQGTGLGFRV